MAKRQVRNKKAAPAKASPEKAAPKKEVAEESEHVMMGGGYEDAPSFASRPPNETRVDLSVQNSEGAYSKNSGAPMLVFNFVIDSGDFAGTSIGPHYMVMGTEKEFGEKQMRALSDGTGFRFKGKLPLDQYAEQWIGHDKALRFSAETQYQYNIEQDNDGGWKNGVSLEEYEEYDGPNKKNIKVQLNPFSFRAPIQEVPDIAVEVGEPWDEEYDEDDDFGSDEGTDEDDPF